MSKFARVEVIRPVVGLRRPTLVDDVRTLADEVFSVPSGGIVRTSDWSTFETRRILFNPVQKNSLKYYLATSIVNNVGLASFELFSQYQEAQKMLDEEPIKEKKECIDLSFDEIELVASSLNPDVNFMVLRTLPPTNDEQESALIKLENESERFRRILNAPGGVGSEVITDELVGRITLGSLKADSSQGDLLDGYMRELRANILPVCVTLGNTQVDFSS